jgi:pseudouridine kinase
MISDMTKDPSFDVSCFGAAHVDLIAQAEETLVPFSSTPGRIMRTVGGVASNVARQLARQKISVTMVSQVGQDLEGDFVCQTLNQAGVNTDQILRQEQFATGCYLAIEDTAGDLAMAVSDTHALLSINARDLFDAGLKNTDAKHWFLDANLTTEMITELTAIDHHPPVAIDAVSVSKSVRLRKKLTDHALIFCNKDEAEALLEQKFNSTWEAGQAMAAQTVKASVITDGPHPLCVQSGTEIKPIQVPPVEVSSVTGAGDALIAGTLAGLIEGLPLPTACLRGISAAAQQLTRSG